MSLKKVAQNQPKDFEFSKEIQVSSSKNSPGWLRMKKNIENKGKIILQTGYGPSGLPHIGTFGEVARTSMIVNALNHLSDLPKEIITFSDDMDGLRKVPENIPNPEKLE